MRGPSFVRSLRLLKSLVYRPEILDLAGAAEAHGTQLPIRAKLAEYQGRGLAGWLWSLAVIAIVYLTLSRLLDTSKKFAPRTYRFAE